MAAPPASTKACIDAFDQGQRSRTDRHLKQAQKELLVCTQESCPVVLRADCSSVLRTVEAAMPSAVFAADDGEGHDLVDVRVKLGNEVLAEKLDAKAIEFDPGTYELRFEKAGLPPQNVPYVASEGEKNRVIRVSFKPRPPSVVAIGPELPEPKRSVVGWSVPIGLGVLGVSALAVAGIGRMQFASDRDDLRATCAPDCSQAQRADLSDTVVQSNVALGLGLGLLAGAAISWFVLRPAPGRRLAWAF